MLVSKFRLINIMPSLIVGFLFLGYWIYVEKSYIDDSQNFYDADDRKIQCIVYQNKIIKSCETEENKEVMDIDYCEEAIKVCKNLGLYKSAEANFNIYSTAGFKVFIIRRSAALIFFLFVIKYMLIEIKLIRSNLGARRK